MKKLDETELQIALAELPSWKLLDGKLSREWTFPDFNVAMKFVNEVAGLAEAECHHPDIDIRYNRVRLALVTHDAGGITRSDIRMCAVLDQNL